VPTLIAAGIAFLPVDADERAKAIELVERIATRRA